MKKHHPPQLDELLTPRELEVLRMMGRGQSNEAIAAQLFITLGTARWYTKEIYSKLGVHSRAEAIVCAAELGLLDWEIAPTNPHDNLGPKHNLPSQTTPFVGRRDELDAIHLLLADPATRLLTILAPGGMGKTRLALEAARRQLGDYKHGARFIPLQSIREPHNIIPQIANSTGYQFSNDGSEPKQQVLDFLSNKQMLLLLDNFEHLLGRAPLLREIVQAAPHVKLLVTSREKLNLSMETVYALGGLTFSGWKRPESALDYDAVQLLLQMAKRVKPDWEVTPDNLDAVARICRLTQGMPLGILLAASWLDVLSLDRICDEVQNGADILETEQRDITERQRSIRAVFEATWERLKPAEKEVFMRMSVFRGGCSPAAAEQITGASPRTLQGLVNKALLMRNREGRYDIHELLRQYAMVELEQAGAADTVRDAHMDYYANALHEREADLKDHRQLDALDDIAVDFENARAAWERAAEQQNHGALRAMIGPLAIFGKIRTRHEEIYTLVSPVVRSLQGQSQPDDRLEKLLAWIAGWYGGLATNLTYHAEAETVARRGLELAWKHEDGLAAGKCLTALANAVCFQGRIEEAIKFITESVAILRECDDPYALSLALQRAGYFASLNTLVDDYVDDCIKFTQECLEIAREIGNKYLMAHALNNLAATSDDPEQVKRYDSEILALRREIGDKVGLAWALMDQFEEALHEMQWDEAKRLLEEGISLEDDINNPNAVVRITLGKAEWKLYDEDYEAALPLFREALALAKRIGHPMFIAFGKFYVAVSLVFLGEFDAAISGLVDAASSLLEFEARHRPVSFNFYSLPLARILRHRGESERCAELLGSTFEDKRTRPFIKQHPYMVSLQDELKSELGDEVFSAAWKRGKALDLETVWWELMAEFGDYSS